ncbi:MAG: hypothetical protein JWO82_590 [Akkermansiaceae bacterium]|nr:hypothetical protein [Akkermansiaceae bacterium]
MKHPSVSAHRKVSRIMANCALIAALMSCAQASVIMTEAFDYTPATDGLNGQNGGTGWGGTWNKGGFDTVAPGLTYPGLITGGNAASNTGGQTFRHITTTTPDTGSVFVSFLMNQPGADYANMGLFRAGNEVMSFGDTYNGGGPSANYSMYFGGVAGLSGYQGSGANIATGTQFIVLELDLSTAGQTGIYLYLNPSTSATTLDHSSAISSATATESVTFDEIRLENSNATMDELRIGTTYGDITQVPEAGSGALALLAGLAVFSRRSRR